ncbi:DUF262 domain-containing protein [Cryobacterium sp. TMT1-2-1]|uniref:DUF262 and DUF1524 domain-containing protein n=1 Tax=Cryobacterium sp. TMT1-2-1 TaxID=1259232 RepID=UPI00106A4FF1|nr:DUF262 and DUF1524 domain-containing protein [Cryobacterium sp. TMT1-2-1]TFD47154.1 DUF262 domain-containing protein [Cryobacterium sp. TMT1-2-1]
MKAVDTHLLTLLKKSNQFEVPIYQRAYAWTDAECEQLWRDIIRAGSSDKLGAHFTGSVVHVEKATGPLTEAEPNLIIDGQQRVTTVTLILTALAHALAQLPPEAQQPLDGFSPKKIRGRYLLNDDEDGERRFKLLLSQGDKETLKAIVQGFEPPAGSTSRVAENFRFFQQKFTNSKLDLATVCIGLSKLTVVDIRLELNMDHPQLVFEAMNSTGKRLSQADLIRNFVLMDLPPREQERLYEQYWRPMELDFGQSAYESQFDQFVRHFLTVVTGNIPRLDDIYDSFKDYAAILAKDGDSIETRVIELRAYSKRYCAIALGKEPQKALRRAFKNLDQIKADVVFPFLLELYSDYELGSVTEAEVLEIVDLVTSYIFRRAVVRVPTNSLNTTFATFGKSLRKDKYVESVKAHFLGMAGYRRFPTDREFSDELRISDLYNFKRRSYFLRMMENFGRKELVSVEDYTIEHILPQNENLRAQWRHDLGDGWQDIQAKYLHTLGNLTLTGYNSEYSDRAFLDKRDMDGGFRDSPLRLNNGLGLLVVWNAEAIETRAAVLAAEAVQIWRRPVLSPGTIAGYQEPRPDTGFTIKDHPKLLPGIRRNLFEQLSSEVLALDPAVTRHFLKLYVAFKTETNFLDVVPQVARLRLSLAIPLESLSDDRGLAYDVRGKGHWGNGPSEVTLNEESDFAYVMGLVRQAYEYQMGGD